MNDRSLFDAAAEVALTEATAATERATGLHGAARLSVEREAAKVYDVAAYWARFERGAA